MRPPPAKSTRNHDGDRQNGPEPIRNGPFAPCVSAVLSEALSRNGGEMMRLTVMSALIAAAALTPTWAQDPAKTPVEQETERLRQQNQLETVRLEQQKLEVDRIKALNLPSFEGKTDLGEGAGAIEAAMLSTASVREAAITIAEMVTTNRGKPDGPDTVSQTPSNARPIIIVGRSEALDFGSAGVLNLQLDQIREGFDDALKDDPAPALVGQDRSVAGVIAAFNAVSGLVRSDLSIKAAAVTIDDRALIAELSRRLDGKVFLPSAAIGAIEKPPAADAQWEGQSLLAKWTLLTDMRQRAAALRKSLGAEPAGAAKAKAALLDRAVARYDAFAATNLQPNAAGLIPLAAAARLEKLAKGDPFVLRVSVEQAGASLVTTKNLFTSLGLDPLKVSGGLLVSFTFTEPLNGQVRTSALLACGSNLAHLRRVQEGTWRKKLNGAVAKPHCEPRD